MKFTTRSGTVHGAEKAVNYVTETGNHCIHATCIVLVSNRVYYTINLSSDSEQPVFSIINYQYIQMPAGGLLQTKLVRTEIYR